MHVAKYTRKGLGNLFAHYERKGNDKRNYSNKDIDKERTNLNYNLAPDHEVSSYEFTKSRCEELNVLKRDDVNWICDWCISLPSEIKGDEEKSKAFFKATYKFLSERYGEENVVSSYVHRDELGAEEGNQHMHFCWIPVYKKQEVTFDTETGELITKTIEKVSAKVVISREELLAIHNDLQEYLDGELDFSVSVRNGNTSEHGNQTVKQLKEKRDLQADIAKLQKERNLLARNVSALINETSKLEKQTSEFLQYNQNLLTSSDVTLDGLKRELENRDNIVYNINTTFVEVNELTKQIKEKQRELAQVELKSKKAHYYYDDLDFA